MEKSKIKVITDDRILVTSTDPVNYVSMNLSKIFPASNIRGPREIPCGDVPYEVLNWIIDDCIEFRLLLNKSGHALSFRNPNGMFWIVSESSDSRVPELHDYDLTDFDTYINDNISEAKAEDHILYPFSDSGDKTYKVDMKEVTCTCSNFKYRCSHFTSDKDGRYCKHLSRAYQTYPEYLPQSIKDTDSSDTKSNVSPDGKVRYPRAVLDMYVSDIRNTLCGFQNIIEKFEVCGSYRRLEPLVSDLDFLLVIKEGHDWNPILDYFENLMGFQLVPQIGRGEAKAGYLVDGYVRVDFKVVPVESWPYALLHFTGSKANNIELRRLANRKGWKLNEYGLYNESTGESIGTAECEKDIFNLLGVPYKDPWKR